MLRRILLPALVAIAMPSEVRGAVPSELRLALIAPITAAAQSAPTPLVSPAPQTTQQATSSVANLLPENTPGVLLINTNEALWEDLSKFGLFPRDMTFPSWLYPTPIGVNFYSAVQPWLGDQIGIALLPETENKKQDRSVTIASIKDATQVALFIEQLKKAKKNAPIQHQYQGVTILEWEPEKLTPKEAGEAEESNPPMPKLQADSETPDAPQQPLPSLPAPVIPTGYAIAVLPNHVVTAFSIDPIKQLIDAQAAGKPLTNSSSFQKTITRSQYARSLFVGYGNYTEVLKALDTFNQSQLDKLPPNVPKPPKLDYEKLDVLGSFYDAIEGYVWAESDGLHFNTSINFKRPVPESLIEKMQTRNEILERLPELNYVVSNGQNLALFWQVLMTGLEADPNIKKQVDQYRQFAQKFIGLDDRDIFPWMNQEIAVFMYPTRQGFLPAAVPNLDLGFGLMVQTSDRPAAEAALKKIDQQLQNLGIRPSNSPANSRPDSNRPGNTVTSFNLPIGEKNHSFLSHSWIAPDTLLILSGGGAVSEFNPQPTRTLPQSSNFRSAIAPLPESNLGYFYINGGATMTLVNNSILPLFLGKELTNQPFFNDVKATLGSIRSISGASGVTSEKIQADGFMALAVTRSAPITASELIELGQEKRFTDTEGAIANFTRALKLDPQNVEAYTGRASVFSQESPTAALADLNQAIRLAPDNADIWAQRSGVREQLFDYQGALEDISQAITQQPNDPIFHIQRSNIRLALEDYKGAIADADIALKTEDFSIAFNNRCYARARGLGEFKAALPDCEKAIASDPESPSNLTSRCYVRANLKDKKALEDCELAIDLDPDYSYNYEDRGLAKLALGDRQGALDDLQTAAQRFKQQGDTVGQKRVEQAILKIK